MRLFFLFFLLPLALGAATPQEVTLYVSGNLGGRFPLDQDLQENELMKLSAYLRQAREKNPAAFHFDLGNAFFPGRLSRFSFGSLTADYLQLIRLDAGLVAAGDLNIGAESLDYIRRARGIRLLSANILRDKQPFFEPYAIFNRGGVKVAALGITSNRSLVNYAEAQLLALRLETPQASITGPLGQLAAEKPDLTISLSGLGIRDAVALLAKNPQIDIVICGGDADGTLGKEQVRQIELPDGRRVIALPRDNNLMRLVLRREAGNWTLFDRQVIDLATYETTAAVPPTFARRLSLWQKWYAAREDTQAPQTAFQPFRLTPQYTAASLRSAFGCDVSYVEDDDVTVEDAEPVANAEDVRYAVQNDYDVFTFRMTGAELRQFYLKNPELVFSGMNATSVTGYPIRDNVRYRVCATQRGYELAVHHNKNLTGKNQWLGLSGAVQNTLREGVRDPDAHADSRFRFLAILNLSNVYETGRVTNGSGIETPPGQAADSYFKWGLENDVNFILYNRRHSISFNPYIFYVRQMDQIIRNLLRADVTYTYNTESFVKPYQKNRVDTVVVPVNGQRPSFLRETLGAEFSYKIFTGRLGAGMEKEILDPVNDPNWGFESNIALLWPFYEHMQYKLAFDAFSSRTYQNFWRHRVEISNAVIFTVAAPITFTVSHRWYYFYLGSVGDFYNSSIMLLSLDMRTTWKEP